MTFEELPLYQAVYRVFQSVEKPGSDDWISSNAKMAYKLVLLQIVEQEGWTDEGIFYPMQRIVEVWRDLRKVVKTRLKCEVSLTHGSRCFWAERGVGPCSEEVDLDRIIPESRGGKYQVENCMIVCSYHNRSRGDRFIEEYLGSSLDIDLRPETGVDVVPSAPSTDPTPAN
jgi:hypothetical protein